MKPKYYSCFFLSLFACGQENKEVKNAESKDADPKGNLLNRDLSIIDVVNNLCEGVKDINDKNNPSAYVELTTKLVGEYANSFWSLERCQGIFKQLCEQVPSYPSQIVYDVLYALLKNKCLDAVGVQTIIQGIKEKNPKVFSLLNNYVCLNRSRVNETDEPARIIAESFGFIFNNTIFIPGINTFTSTPIPLQEKGITIDDLTNIWQCVRFIINNGFDTKSLKKLIKLASSGDFNEAIKAIADAGILFKDIGDDMMKAFEKEEVNLNDAGLQALANCIRDAKQIVTTQNVKHLIPSLQNCKHLAPIFNKCTNAVQVDDEFLLELADKCTDNYHDLIESIPQERFNINNTKREGYLSFLNQYRNVNKEGLSPLFSKLPNFFREADFLKLLGYIDLNSATSLDTLVESLQDEKFNLGCLKILVKKYNNNSDKFNKVLSLINPGKFDNNADGNGVIGIFKYKEIQLDDGNLIKILSMINDTTKISDCEKAIDFWCKNIKNLNEQNIKAVFEKVEDDKKFNLNDLGTLWAQGKDKFDQILPCIPKAKLKQDHKGNDVIKTITALSIKLNTKTIPNVLSMIDDLQKISHDNNTAVFKFCCDKDNEFVAEDIKNILSKCDNFEFVLDLLNVYAIIQYKAQFNAILSAIPDKYFVSKCKGDDVLEEIQYNEINVAKGNLRKILLLCKDGEKITNVNALYYVFCRSCKDEDGVKDLINLVAEGSLNGNDFISEIDDKAQEAKAQKDFIEKFYSKIQDKSIDISNRNAKNFVVCAYIWYKKEENLNDLLARVMRKSFYTRGAVKKALKIQTLKNFCDKDITDDDFQAFKNALTGAIKKL